MVTARLYVEGAGQTDLDRKRCRQAFAEFFTSAGLEGKLPRTVPCGARSSAYDAFVIAVKTAKTAELPLLLVDSEDAVMAGHTSWQHLKARDNWDRPAGAAEDQAFLMVQVMETWFLADKEMLRRYFGAGLREQHLPAWPALENVPKVQVFEALDGATRGGSRPYTKGKVSFELLSVLDANKVEAACTHARELLQRLRSL